MSKLRKILKNKSGLSIPLAVAIVLAIIMIMVVITEYMRINLIAQGVRDAVQSAIISTVNDNYDDVYHGVREGYAGGYQPVGGDFEESIDHGEVYDRLDGLLGLRTNGGYHTKSLGDGKTEIKLSGLRVEVINIAIAPSDPANTQRFMANATIQLEVPVSFAGKLLPPMKINLKLQAGWTKKF